MKPKNRRKPAAIAIAKTRRDQKTFVVVGSGRGGTSVVSGLVHILGVRMFDHPELNSEDSEIVQAYQGNMKRGHAAAAREVSRVIASRNASHDVWGWKDPSADLYLECVLPNLRDPHFIFVFRNPLDVALSHVETNTVSIEIGLDSALNRYMRYWGLLQKFGCPTLMVSYERVLADKSGFISELSSFLKVSPSKSQVNSATAFIKPDGGYQKVTQKT